MAELEPAQYGRADFLAFCRSSLPDSEAETLLTKYRSRRPEWRPSLPLKGWGLVDV